MCVGFGQKSGRLLYFGETPGERLALPTESTTPRAQLSSNEGRGKTIHGHEKNKVSIFQMGLSFSSFIIFRIFYYCSSMEKLSANDP